MSDPLTLAPADPAPAAARLQRIYGAIPALSAVLVVALIFRDSLLQMAQLWLHSQTYAHGFLIVPVSGWLAWSNLSSSAPRPLEPAPWGLAGLAGAVLLWMAGHVAQAGVVEQFAVIGAFGAIVTSVCGLYYARRLAFPLAFLLLAVPFGDPLIEPLMKLTASGTVQLLQLTGIPVFRNGMMFSTSSGNFEIAQACSGIRYLMASVSTGVLYAYIALHTLRYRVLFTAIAAIVPIVANSIRAYLIVLIAHLSDMKMAQGVDHLVYGWVFFALVMIGLLGIGEWLRRRETRGLVSTARTAPAATAAVMPTEGLRTVVLVAAICVALAAGGATGAQRIDARLAQVPNAPQGFPQAHGGWTGPLAATLSWKLGMAGAPTTLTADYEHPHYGRIVLNLVYYTQESSEGKLITTRNELADRKIWHLTTLDAVRSPALGTWAVTRFDNPANSNSLTIWSVYALRGRALTSPFIVKAATPLARIESPGETAVLIAVGSIGARGEGARDDAVADFVRNHVQELMDCSRPKSGQVSGNCSGRL